MKNDETHHYSNEAIAQKLTYEKKEFSQSFGQMLDGASAHRIENHPTEASDIELPEKKSLLSFVKHSEQVLRNDLEKKSVSIKLQQSERLFDYRVQRIFWGTHEAFLHIFIDMSST